MLLEIILESWYVLLNQPDRVCVFLCVCMLMLVCLLAAVSWPRVHESASMNKKLTVHTCVPVCARVSSDILHILLLSMN